MDGLRILITGASGFVGGNLARAFEDQELYLGVRSRGTSPISGAHLVQLDLSEPLNDRELPARCDVVIHEAAITGSNVPEGDAQVLRVNVAGTLELLEWARRSNVSKFLFASSAGVYGYSSSVLAESTVTNPVNYYTLTKFLGEEVCRYYARYFDVIVHRYFFPYGPGQKKGLIPYLADRISLGEEITIHNDGNPRTNPVFINDLAACSKACLDLHGYRVVNIAGPEAWTVRELAETLAGLLGGTPKFRWQPNPDIEDLVGDRTCMKELGLEAETGLTDGLQRFVEAYVASL